MLQAMIESWRASEIGWSNRQYEDFGKVTEKARAISSAASKIFLGIGKASSDDLPAMEESYRKFAMLIKPLHPFRMTKEEALRRLAEWEKRHG